MSDRPPPRAVLFDLDGTLLDTARDLAGALNRVRAAHGRTALPFAALRPYVSHGSFALIRVGFELEDSHPDFEPLRLQLLAEYHAQIAAHTCLFEGIERVLDWLVANDLRWGIVTNKPGWLTAPLLAQTPLPHAPGCVVSGDTLATRKPDPAPLLYAAAQLDVAAADCLYVGDAERDVEAGRRAQMATLVALYGYLGPADRPLEWGADGTLAAPLELCDWLTARWAGFAR